MYNVVYARKEALLFDATQIKHTLSLQEKARLHNLKFSLMHYTVINPYHRSQATSRQGISTKSSF